MAAFLGGYAAVWTWFGAFAFLGDIVIHELVHRSTWLGAANVDHRRRRPGTRGGLPVLEPEERLPARVPQPGLLPAAALPPGVREAFRIGYGHGLYCLGCCWALMLLGFAVGVASLPWMAPLTLVMVFEKTGRGGDRGARPIGVALLTLAALVLVVPGAAPMLGFESG